MAAQKVFFKVMTMTDDETKQKAMAAAAILGVCSIDANVKEQKLIVIGEMDALAVADKLKKVGKVLLVSSKEAAQLKVVFKVITMIDEKTRLKAMRAANDILGIDSITADVKEQKIIVIGAMDALAVAHKLKKVGKVLFVSADPAKEEKKKVEKKEEKEERPKEKKKEDKKEEEKLPNKEKAEKTEKKEERPKKGHKEERPKERKEEKTEKKEERPKENVGKVYSNCK